MKIEQKRTVGLNLTWTVNLPRMYMFQWCHSFLKAI